MNSKPARTFAEHYCAKHAISPDAFDLKVMRRCLYLHARLLEPVLRFGYRDHFAADLDFVRAVGRLTRVRDFSMDAADFSSNPANRGFLRLTLRMRVSSSRLQALVRETMPRKVARDPRESDGTAVPFALPSNPASRSASAARQESS